VDGAAVGLDLVVLLQPRGVDAEAELAEAARLEAVVGGDVETGGLGAADVRGEVDDLGDEAVGVAVNGGAGRLVAFSSW
jgi:hypothetical protein